MGGESYGSSECPCVQECFSKLYCISWRGDSQVSSLASSVHLQSFQDDGEAGQPGCWLVLESAADVCACLCSDASWFLLLALYCLGVGFRHMKKTTSTPSTDTFPTTCKDDLLPGVFL